MLKEKDKTLKWERLSGEQSEETGSRVSFGIYFKFELLIRHPYGNME